MPPPWKTGEGHSEAAGGPGGGQPVVGPAACRPVRAEPCTSCASAAGCAYQGQRPRGGEVRSLPFYFRFSIGPLRFSQRLGQTQAQKRAVAKARAERQDARD